VCACSSSALPFVSLPTRMLHQQLLGLQNPQPVLSFTSCGQATSASTHPWYRIVSVQTARMLAIRRRAISAWDSIT
jgi:hypothetical protein